MHENERNQQDSTYDKDFLKLVEVLHEQDDSGMVAFEGSLKDAQQYLLDTYVYSDAPVDYNDLADIEQDLVEEWPHEGNIARLSGRLYLNDLEEEDAVEKVLGAGAEDETGQKYYIVENRELKSAGIDVLTTHRSDGSVSDIKIVYTFSMLNDEDDLPTLRAAPEDLYEHVYERPTPQQAIEQLEQYWPQQFLLLREWVHFVGETPLPARLHYIANELQKELADSEDFRRCAECYLQEFVALDQEHPFNLIISGEVDYYDGASSPYSEGKNAKWSKLTIDGRLQTYGYYPKIELLKRSDGSIEATMMFATYNNEDGDEAEYIRLNADTIQLFRPTRSIGSLASRAMESGSRELVLEAITADAFNTVSLQRNFETTQVEYEDDEKESEQDLLNQIPERIQGLQKFEEVLSYIAKLAEVQGAVRYSTPEEAHDASVAFLQNEVSALIKKSVHFKNLQLTVSGATIAQPQIQTKSVGSKHNKKNKNFMLEINHEEPIKPMQPGDFLQGTLLRFVPRVAAQSGMGQDPVFMAGVSLVMLTEKETLSPISLNNVELVNLTVGKNIIVPIDGVNEIKVTSLESYREAQRVVRELDQSFPDREATHLIDALFLALINEDDSSFNEFTRTDLLSNLKAKTLRDNGGEKLFERTVRAMEAMLVGRSLQLNGDMFRKKKSGKYERIALNEEVTITGTVVDVRTDIKKDEIFLSFSIGSDKTDSRSIVYVRAHSISKFLF